MLSLTDRSAFSFSSRASFIASIRLRLILLSSFRSSSASQLSSWSWISPRSKDVGTEINLKALWVMMMQSQVPVAARARKR